MSEKIRELSHDRAESVTKGIVHLAHTRLNAAGETSLFTELPLKPDIYPGQAIDEFFVPGLYSTREEMLAEGLLFCPNLLELLKEREADVEYWTEITRLVNEGYRIIPLTNHRNLPDVVLDKLIDALILSQDKYLGRRYFEISSVAAAKPISLYGYGMIQSDETGFWRPRSAVETITIIGGVELPLPGTLTIKGSAYITDEDRRIVNEPILKRRAKMQEDGEGLITNMAGSASEDWTIRIIGGRVIVIQQPMSRGTIRDLTGEKTVVAPRAVVFDEKWNARIWTGKLQEINHENEAHNIQAAHNIERLIAEQAEILSGDITRYIDDHGALDRIAKFRRQATILGERAIELVKQITDRSDVEELDDLPIEEQRDD